ncbi:hypothetical protein DV515_00011462 [Chloebia gouldiae]|uniref:IF rod domain-containing protein n=1 Tax=Chloebia gouldiae TaxID=44316 RepID=A0A3L8S691_CHLGU|nr:hypothetical protein DV515_00011462 [Chloebia gouldiae]
MDRFEIPQGGEAAASFPAVLQLPFSISVRLDKLSEVAKVNTDAMRLAQEEISEYRRQLQAKTTELEALKGTQESLERQRQDSEERHHADVLSYQVPWRSGQRPRLGRDHPAAGEGQWWDFGFRDVKELSGLPQSTGIRNPEPEVVSGLLCPSAALELSHGSAWHGAACEDGHKCHGSVSRVWATSSPPDLGSEGCLGGLGMKCCPQGGAHQPPAGVQLPLELKHSVS